MTISLAGLRSKRVEVELTIDGEPLNVTYAPDKMTLRVRTELRVGLAAYMPRDKADEMDAIEAQIGEAFVAYCATLAGVLVTWDIVDGKKPYPLSAETLAALHPDIVLGIGREVAKHSSANPRIAANSNSTSQATE